MAIRGVSGRAWLYSQRGLRLWVDTWAGCSIGRMLSLWTKVLRWSSVTEAEERQVESQYPTLGKRRIRQKNTVLDKGRSNKVTCTIFPDIFASGLEV